MCWRRACSPRSRGRAATGSVPPRSPARPCSPACSCSPAFPRVPRRPSPGPPLRSSTLPQLTVLPSKGVATQIGPKLARQIAGDLVADLRIEADALRTRDKARAATAAGGTRLQGLWAQIDAAGTSAIIVPAAPRRQAPARARDRRRPGAADRRRDGHRHRAARHLPRHAGGGRVHGQRRRRSPARSSSSSTGSRYLIVGSRGGTPEAVAPDSSAKLVSSGVGGARLENVAPAVGIDFQQNAFRTKATMDVTAMMGGGVCWVDIDGDGWLDLFAVNSYADDDLGYWLEHGGMPRSALFHNVKGRFTDVSRSSGADVQLRGNGCVAGDFNGDGSTDIYVTAAGNDALLWNDGKGHFSEGARAAGITAWGWHAGAAVADVNGDGRPDIFVSGYADVERSRPRPTAGFPNNYQGVRDLLYLNTGNDAQRPCPVPGGR